MKVCLRNAGLLHDMPLVAIDHFPFVIGRQENTDYCLPLAFVSRQHCQFTQQGDVVMVQDLESHNGTFVNGRKAVAPIPITHGDELSLGPASFQVLHINDSWTDTVNQVHGPAPTEVGLTRPKR